MINKARKLSKKNNFFFHLPTLLALHFTRTFKFYNLDNHWKAVLETIVFPYFRKHLTY